MPILTDELLERIHERAPRYDAANAFFDEDLAELVEAGYLTALVPVQFGGRGMSLPEVVREQERLASVAPATALAVNMHLMWTGIAAMLHASGDTSMDFVLTEAAAGEIYAFAISEAGNDAVLFDSSTVAEPLADGSYSFTGLKVFTTLSPAWTRLGTFGRDETSVDAPKLVYGVLTRGTAGIEVLGDWNTIGMRATQSHSTRLDSAVVEPSRVFRRLDPGPNRDPLIFGIFANFEILIAAVYSGIATRALQLAVEAARSKRSAVSGITKDQDPITRWKIAEAALAVDALAPRLQTMAADVSAGVDHGDQWFRQLVGLKHAATTTAQFVVNQAIAVTGGASFSAGSEVGRLYRDVLAGGFHPSNDDSVHATVATAVLGPPA